MNSNSILFGLFLIGIIIFFYIVENRKEMKERLDKNDPAIEILIITIVVSLLVTIFSFGHYTYQSTKRLSKLKEYLENERLFAKVDERIVEEGKYYTEKKKSGIDISKANEPYLLDGFNELEGTVADGYVISDKLGNEFVWIPCSIDNNNFANFEKRNFSNNAYQSKDTCYDENYKEFIDSVFENGGFYVSRYEITTKDGEYYSKPNMEIAYVESKEEAKNISSKILEGYNVELINGIAYDAMLSWLIGDAEKLYLYEDKEVLSGRNEVKNIYDVFDNIFELTDECSYGTLIKRGTFDSEWDDEKELQSRIPEMDDFLTYDKIAFRVVLYK